MGKPRDFGFKPEHSQLLSARAHPAPAAAKAPSLDEPAPEPKLEPAAKVERPASPRESRVSHTARKDPTAAVRRARWRKKNPEQHADQQRAARARRKATAQIGKVTYVRESIDKIDAGRRAATLVL